MAVALSRAQTAVPGEPRDRQCVIAERPTSASASRICGPVASARARQLLRGALPRDEGEKKVTIAQREVLRRKVEKVQEDV